MTEMRVAQTIFGPVLVPGPFADDYTKLKWKFTEHWSGEWAIFQVAGLKATVRDCDGDLSYWELKDIRTHKVLAKGEDHEHVPLPHFWKCLVEAEQALRAEVARRKQRLISLTEG